MSRFLGELDLRDLGDGARFIMLAALTYESDRLQAAIVVPIGTITDLASIPLISNHRRWSKAAVVHDHLYDLGELSRGECDAVLGEAMACLQVPRWRRWVVLSQLKLWGWKAWRNHRRADQGATT